MKKICIFLTSFLLFASFVLAEQYRLASKDCVIFYRTNENSKEVRIFPGSIIPNENVYLRVHADERDGRTFELESIESHRIFICSAPNQWPGIKLSESIIRKKNSEDRERVNVAYTLAMGNGELKRVRKFHCLFAFVSDFDDKQWASFPYSNNDIQQMQQAIDVLRSQQQYLRGKQYLLTAPRVTKSQIINCMDSILQNAGEEDFIFLYLSSHGEKDAQGQFNLITKDTYRSKNGGFVNSLTKTEINDYVNLLTAKNARVLFFLDACYAGAVLDNNIQGEAAYYVSTNGENAAYYNKLFGSPFALALTEVMTGALNEKYTNYFKDNQVQIASLGNYLSSSVFDRSQQQPMSDGHAFSPSFVLWNIHNTQKKEPLVIKLLAEQAENNPTKMIELGDRYYEGNGVTIDFYKAFDCYKKAAERSQDKNVRSEALLRMTQCFYYGNPEQDSVMVFNYTREAASLGNTQAMAFLGKLYMVGYGIKKDNKEGLKWLQKAANKKEILAQFELGLEYYEGTHVPQDYQKAVEWFTKAAKQGDASALHNIGVCYYDGTGVRQNYSKAVEYFTIAAEKGLAEAQYNLGLCYELGEGVAQNRITAIKWYSMAAKQGFVDAQNCLGNRYYYGEGVPKDYAKAVEWYTRAAEQGDAEAQEMLGYLYYMGQGVPKDYVKAVEWYTKAAEQGIISAQNSLGNRYYYGEGVPKDYAKAVEWYTRAAEQGEVDAQYNLGNRYYFGEGVQQDYKKAVEWYTKAADGGNNSALNSLGNCYYYGKGIQQDYAKAAECYAKAAEKGHAIAQYNLGLCYYNGKGVSKNKEVALEWFKKSAAQNHQNAIDFIKKYYGK